MGVNTWAAFAGTPDDALVVGDFAVLEGELQTVLKTLSGADINIVAIHQHMTGENPRMIFLHYYGRGKALDLSRRGQSGYRHAAVGCKQMNVQARLSAKTNSTPLCAGLLVNARKSIAWHVHG